MLTIRTSGTFNPLTFSCDCNLSPCGVRNFRHTRSPSFFFTGLRYNCQKPPAPPVFRGPGYDRQRPQTATDQRVRSPREFRAHQAVRVEIAPLQASHPVDSIKDASRSAPYSFVFKPGERRFDTQETLEAYHARKLQDKQANPPMDSIQGASRSAPYSFVFKPGERKFDTQETMEAYHARKLQGKQTNPPVESINNTDCSVASDFPSAPASSTCHPGKIVERVSRQAIDIIVKDLQTSGSWNNYAGEIATYIITRLPSWPQNKYLQVKVPGGIIEYGKQAATDPIIVQLQQGHYESIINGQVTAVASDGNCFYHSLLSALPATEQQQLLGTAFTPYDRRNIEDDPGNPNMLALRQLLASHVQQNSSLIRAFQEENAVTDEKIIHEHEQAQTKRIEQTDAALAQELQAEEDEAIAWELQTGQNKS